MTHKCCGNRKKGQALKLNFLSKSEGLFLVNFAGNSLTVFEDRLFGETFTSNTTQTYKHSLSIDSNGNLIVKSRYFYTLTYNKPAFCDFSDRARMTGTATDTEYFRKEIDYLFRTNGSFSRGSFINRRPREMLKLEENGLGKYVRTWNYIVRENDICSTFTMPIAHRFTQDFNLFIGTVYEINQEALRLHPNAQINAVIPVRNKSYKTYQCISLNLTRADLSTAVTPNIVLTGNLNGVLNFTYGRDKQKQLTVPYDENSFFFNGYEVYECGCAKGEIECNVNGKKCCIDCCDIAENIYNKYKPIDN